MEFEGPHRTKPIENFKQPYKKYIDKYCKGDDDIVILRDGDKLICATLSRWHVISYACVMILPPRTKKESQDKVVKATITWIIPKSRKEPGGEVRSSHLFRGSTSKEIGAQNK